MANAAAKNARSEAVITALAFSFVPTFYFVLGSRGPLAGYPVNLRLPCHLFYQEPVHKNKSFSNSVFVWGPEALGT